MFCNFFLFTIIINLKSKFLIFLGNTLFILAKWKGREYHGVLSNGEHPMEHIYAQKK